MAKTTVRTFKCQSQNPMASVSCATSPEHRPALSGPPAGSIRLTIESYLMVEDACQASKLGATVEAFEASR